MYRCEEKLCHSDFDGSCGVRGAVARSSHGNASKFGRSPLFSSVAAFFALLLLYPLYRLANRWPRFRVGIGIIAANTLLCGVLAFLYFGLHLDNLWIDRMFDMSQVLLLSGCLLLAWQGARSHRQDNHRP